MADTDHYVAAANGLEAAAKALRACGEEESSEDTPREDQAKDLKGANAETKRQFARKRADAD